MKKLKIPTSRKVNILLICLISAFIGWESHVFKLWVVDILNKDLVCDEVKCREIKAMAIELDNYKIPNKENKK